MPQSVVQSFGKRNSRFAGYSHRRKLLKIKIDQFDLLCWIDDLIRYNHPALRGYYRVRSVRLDTFTYILTARRA